ncbi:MAG: hypothetical protein ACRDGA_04065, partial [Bacteroidota bacterium]
NIEIGFSAFGSTVSLPGTLRALKKDVFVSEMHVVITRRSDNAMHNFTWRAFKSSTFSPISMAPEAIEIATSFNLPVSAPRPINVFFASADFASRYAQQAEDLRTAWYKFGMQKVNKLGNQIATLVQTPGFADNLFSEFSNSPAPLALFTQLNHRFFWQSGEYRLDLHVRSASPTKPTKDSWRFDITADDEQKLRLNSSTVLKEVCGLQVQYNFIYKPYDVVT